MRTDHLLKKGNDMEQETLSLTEVTKLTGLSRSKLNLLEALGRITYIDNRIPRSIVDRILFEQAEYISLLEYCREHSSPKFNGDDSHDRDIILAYLELNDFWGIKQIPTDDLIISTSRDGLFFFRKDIKLLDSHLSHFWKTAGLSEEELIEHYLQSAIQHSHTNEYLRRFLQEEANHITYTRALSECVRLVLMVPDVLTLKNNDIQSLLLKQMSKRTRGYIVAFLNYVKKNVTTEYDTISLASKKNRIVKALDAYSNETYLALAKCIFGSQYIESHHLIQKALSNHIYSEAWLYIAILFICGWRAQDICRTWRYPSLDTLTHFGIDTASLKDDILNDSLSENTYFRICQYSVSVINSAGFLPSKTAPLSPPPLTIQIYEGLYPFFGLLTLINTVHILKQNGGQMQTYRVSTYQNKITLKNFFGEEFVTALSGENLHANQMNKDYLQSIQNAAKENGCSGIQTSMLASYCRNHTNLNSIKAYLCDKRLTGETADFIIESLLSRGVFGFEPYQALVTMYPDSFEHLSLSQKNRIMERMDVSPLDIELAGAEAAAALSIHRNFLKGNKNGEKQVLANLLSLFEISQGRGLAKDVGAHCILRANMQACPYPKRKSCIATGCRHLVFNHYGHITVLNILKNYNAASKAGDKKAEYFLKKRLIPKYQRIISHLIKKANMNEDDQRGLKILMEDYFNE